MILDPKQLQIYNLIHLSCTDLHQLPLPRRHHTEGVEAAYDFCSHTLGPPPLMIGHRLSLSPRKAPAHMWLQLQPLHLYNLPSVQQLPAHPREKCALCSLQTSSPTKGAGYVQTAQGCTTHGHHFQYRFGQAIFYLVTKMILQKVLKDLL